MDTVFVTLCYAKYRNASLRYVTLCYASLRFVTLCYASLRAYLLFCTVFNTLRHSTLRFDTLWYATLRNPWSCREHRQVNGGFVSYSWIEPPKLISSGRVGWKPLLVVVVGESGLMVVMDVVMGSTPIVAPAAPARGEIYSSERRGLIRECAVIC